MKHFFKKHTLVSFIGLLLLTIITITYQDHLAVSTKEAQKKPETKEVLNPTSKLKISFLDVGQADSILLENNGEYMLIDAGNNEDGPKLVKYFHELGVQNFAYVIATHAHEDHIGGMDDIINNFSIQTFYMPDDITTTKTFEDVLDALENKRITFQTPELDGTFHFAESKFEVIYIEKNAKDLNDSSLILKMTYGNNTFLFMGDATSKVEPKIIEKEIKSDVLKIGHHGSKYSSSQALLDKVSPQYAIISVGADNNYHHPHQNTMKKLDAMAIKTYRTDRDGTIILTTDGTNITFEATKTDTNG